MAIKFLPTPEQTDIVKRCVSAVLDEEEEFCGVTLAPAGGGKTSLTIHLFEELAELAERCRIGYFVFNGFMKDDIGRKAYVHDINNADFYTYHSFLLSHALKNEKLKEHFHDTEGNPLIDFAKQGYSKDEVEKSVSFMLGKEASYITIDFLHDVFNQWHGSDLSVEDYAREVLSSIYSSDDEEDEVDGEYDNSIPESFSQLIQHLGNFEDALLKSSVKLLGLRGLKPASYPPYDLARLFIMEGIKHLTKANKLSHSAYYKEVYSIALRENIDLFEDFDFIVVDEAQDMDKVFKKLIELSGKPKLIIGDSSQSIYAWRGAIDMMSTLTIPHEKFGLSYSFRYDNDVCQLAHLLLMEKENAPYVRASGKYVDRVKNIDRETSTVKDMVMDIGDIISRRLFFAERLIGLAPEEMKPKELRKFLSAEKVAYISRNNSTLIETLFEALPFIRNMDRGDNFHISLTDSVSEDFIKLRKCDFGARTNKRIGELTSQPYNEFKQGKTLEDMLSDSRVRDALFDNNKVSFLLSEQNLENFNYLLEQLSSKKADSISKSDKNANIVFTTVHGSKGKEYKKVFLGRDIFKASSEGILSDEEFHIAYVALTRTKGGLSFVTNRDSSEPHCLYDFTMSKIDEVEQLMKQDYTYTFPFGISMKISQLDLGESPLYQHTFYDANTKETSVFMIEEPIRMGLCSYLGDESKHIIKYRGKGGINHLLSFEGDIVDSKQVSGNMIDFYYGVGKQEEPVKKKGLAPRQSQKKGIKLK